MDPPHMAEQKQDDQLEHTYSSYVRIRDVALKTCHRRWIIGRNGERGSGISVLAARYEDADDDDVKFFKIAVRIRITKVKIEENTFHHFDLLLKVKFHSHLEFRNTQFLQTWWCIKLIVCKSGLETFFYWPVKIRCDFNVLWIAKSWRKHLSKMLNLVFNGTFTKTNIILTHCVIIFKDVKLLKCDFKFSSC